MRWPLHAFEIGCGGPGLRDLCAKLRGGGWANLSPAALISPGPGRSARAQKTRRCEAGSDCGRVQAGRWSRAESRRRREVRAGCRGRIHPGPWMQPASASRARSAGERLAPGHGCPARGRAFASAISETSSGQVSARNSSGGCGKTPVEARVGARPRGPPGGSPHPRQPRVGSIRYFSPVALRS